MCGSCAPSVGPEQVMIALVWGFCNASVLLNFVTKPGRWVDPPRCGICKYDLVLLSPDALCPECGALPRDRARTLPRTVVRVQWHLARRLVPACACFGAAVFVGKHIVALAEAEKLSHAYGYAWSTSVRLVYERPGGHGGDEWIALAFFTAFAPLTAYVRSARVRWLICLLLLLVPSSMLFAGPRLR